MSRIPEEAIRQFLSRIVEQFNPEKVILFGSYARGNPTPDSDVDVLVVLPSDDKPTHKATEILLAVKHPGYPVDLLV
jgi:predicted nucleotidyltransferase